MIPILEEYEGDFPDMKGEMLVVHINIFILSYTHLIYCLYIWVVDGDEGLMLKWGWILDEGERKGYEEEERRLKEEEERKLKEEEERRLKEEEERRLKEEEERRLKEEEERRLKEEEERFREQSRNLQVCNYSRFMFIFYLFRYPSLSLLRVVSPKSCMTHLMQKGLVFQTY